METHAVDPAINKMLESNLPVNGDRDIGDIEDEVFEEEEADDVPISDHTKNMISSLLLSSVSGTPEATIKIINIMKGLEGLTEKQGLLYLKAIQASDMTQVNCQAVSMILRLIINAFFAPDWPAEEKKKVMSDKYIRASISNLLSGVFYKLGHWSGAILLVLYSLESYNFPFIRFKESISNDENSSSAKAPV